MPRPRWIKIFTEYLSARCFFSLLLRRVSSLCACVCIVVSRCVILTCVNGPIVDRFVNNRKTALVCWIVDLIIVEYTQRVRAREREKNTRCVPVLYNESAKLCNCSRFRFLNVCVCTDFKFQNTTDQIKAVIKTPKYLMNNWCRCRYVFLLFLFSIHIFAKL